MTVMMIGDEYLVPFRIKINNKFLTPSGIDKIEFIFGSFSKIYSETSTDGVLFLGDTFLIPLTQEETTIFDVRGLSYQARIKFNTGEVKGSCIKKHFIKKSLSREVI